MSNLLPRPRISWTARRSSRGSDSEDAIAAKVVQATNPHDGNNSAIFADIVSSLASGDANAALVVVRGVKHRLESENVRTVLSSLRLIEHALRVVSKGPFRQSVATELLPKIVIIARGKAVVDGTGASTSSAALKHLETWASRSFAQGALSKHYPMFVEAYKAAHTPQKSPSPGERARRASYERTAAAKKAGTSPLGRASREEVPADDSAFVSFVKEKVGQFESLHSIERVPLADERVKLLRQQLETNMPRLCALEDEAKHSATRSDIFATRQFAETVLKRFPDYVPYQRPSSSLRRDNPAKSKVDKSLSAGSLPPPPAYPPPPQPKRKPDKSLSAPAGYHQQQPVLQSQSAFSDTLLPPVRPLVTKEQHRLLLCVHDTFSQHSRRSHTEPSWWQPPFAELPDDLCTAPPLSDTRFQHLPPPMLNMYPQSSLPLTNTQQFPQYSGHLVPH